MGAHTLHFCRFLHLWHNEKSVTYRPAIRTGSSNPSPHYFICNYLRAMFSSVPNLCPLDNLARCEIVDATVAGDE